MTGIFNILNKKSFLEKIEAGNAEAIEKIYFPDWALIGADYLVRGNITQEGKQIIADCRLFDVTRSERLMSKKYNFIDSSKKEVLLNLEILKNQSKNIELNHNRYKRLQEQDLVSKYDVEQLELNLMNTKNMISITNAKLKEIDTQYDYLKIKGEK